VRGRLHFAFEDTNVLAQFSVPAEDLGLKPLKGRYVNATGTFTVGISNGVMNVNARALSANGTPLPETFLHRIQPQNFAYKLNHHPQASEVLSRLKEVRVSEGRLVIVPRATVQD
jgi:hypothetical protein